MVCVIDKSEFSDDRADWAVVVSDHRIFDAVHKDRARELHGKKSLPRTWLLIDRELVKTHIKDEPDCIQGKVI